MRKETLCSLLVLCGMFFALTSTALAADEVKTIHDPQDDVVDINGNVTSSKPNIDITQIQYTKTGKSATYALTVKGAIENRGSIDSMEGVIYTISLATTDHEYDLIYVNRSCIFSLDLGDPQNITDFTVNGPTLTISFDLQTDAEIYNTTLAYSFDFNALAGEQYSDDVTDLPLQVLLDGPYEGTVGDGMDFFGDTSAFGGSKPYTYLWNFGDATPTSTEQNPTHTYSQAGNYTVTLTVTDSDGTTQEATSFALITGTTPPPPNGNGDNGISNLWLFVILVVIIVIVGVGVIVYLIRR
jgi:hypothetical protein